MEGLLEQMSNTCIDRSLVSTTNPETARQTQYKQKRGADQRSRRDKLLTLQKKSRKEVIQQLRQVDDYDWEIFDSHLLDTHDVDMDETSHTPRKNNPFKDQLMLSEWMIDIPADFESNWVMVFSPQGKRTLVSANRGETRCFSKSGYQLNKFPSKLPGGHRGAKYSGETILDCILNEKDKIFYVIDVLSWNGHSVIESETDFRLFWIKTKIEEIPETQQYSRLNPYVFKTLDFISCNRESLQSAIHQPLSFQLDGLLFYHKHTQYMCGSTPLVVWLKPYMLQEVLALDVPLHFMSDKPTSYSSYDTHLSLIKSDTGLQQKHQELYSSPENKLSKSEKILIHRSKLGTSIDTELKPSTETRESQETRRSHQAFGALPFGEFSSK